MNELLKKLILKNEYENDLENVNEALQVLSLPTTGQGTGFYLRSYAQGYNLIKSAFGDVIRWDKTKNGRETLRQLLKQYKRIIIKLRNEQLRYNINRKKVHKVFKKVMEELTDGTQVSVELSFSYIKGSPEDIDELKQYFYGFRSYYKIRSQLPDIVIL